MLRGDPFGNVEDCGDELFEERFSIEDNGERFTEVGVVWVVGGVAVLVGGALGGVSGIGATSGEEKSTEDMSSEGVCGVIIAKNKRKREKKHY